MITGVLIPPFVDCGVAFGSTIGGVGATATA